MLLNVTQLIVLFSLFLWVASKLTKNRIIFYNVLTAFALLLTIESSSVYLINQPFGYLYWINVNFEDIQVYLFQFYAELAYAGIFLVLVFSLLVYLAKKVGTYKNTRWIKYQWAAPIACLAVLSLPNGIFHNLLDLVRIQFSKVETIEHALAGIGINSSQYVFPDQLKAAPGKNIVVISIESLEKGFLNKNYAGEDITPSLNRLAEENELYPMKSFGGGWTLGSLYVTLTGLPAIFKNLDNGNFILQNLEAINYSTLGEVLNRAGYESRYLMADAEFAGTKDLLNTNHFKVVTNKTGQNLGGFKTANDLDLFSEAKRQIDEIGGKKRPFALFLSTINTHFPNGIYDSRMESLIKRKKESFKSEIDYSVNAVDYLVGDFIDYLRKKNVLDDTIFFIYPDHALMGNNSSVRKLSELGRSLYIITNAKAGDTKSVDKSNLSQLNIPRMIIDGSKVESNVRFPADFTGANFNAKPAIATLNSSIATIKNFKDSLRIEVTKNSVLIDDGGLNNVAQEISENTKWVNFVFNQDLGLKDYFSGSEEFSPYDNDKLLLQPLQLTIFLNRKQLTGLYFGNYKNIGNFQSIDKNKNELYLASSFIDRIKSENKLAFSNIKYKQNLYIPALNFKSIDNYIEVTSSEYTSIQSFPTKIKFGDSFYPVGRGINLLYWDKDQFIFKSYDTHGSQEHAAKLIKKLTELQAKHERYLLVASDAVGNAWNGYQDSLNRLGLSTLALLDGRTAYIGYYNGSKADEYSNPKTISKLISFYREVKEWTPPPKPNLREYLNDKNRFIAHAGGKIDGKIYTDTLDALNHSYSKGFRLLELDILTTSDGYYVAAHDWEHWAKITEYKGVLPPSHEVFMRQKIFGNMQPLDMQEINSWFASHPDAILVTDKVNDPKKFSSQFIDKKRLMMELFDLNAVIEGIDAGILAPMPTGDLWPHLYSNHRDLIQSKKIAYVAASRKIDKLFLSQMLDSGIKIYAFHLHAQPNATEKWVVCNERNLFYGIYADNQDIIRLRNCD